MWGGRISSCKTRPSKSRETAYPETATNPGAGLGSRGGLHLGCQLNDPEGDSTLCERWSHWKQQGARQDMLRSIEATAILRPA